MICLPAGVEICHPGALPPSQGRAPARRRWSLAWRRCLVAYPGEERAGDGSVAAVIGDALAPERPDKQNFQLP